MAHRGRAFERAPRGSLAYLSRQGLGTMILPVRPRREPSPCAEGSMPLHGRDPDAALARMRYCESW